jgi:hypothetical protein
VVESDKRLGALEWGEVGKKRGQEEFPEDYSEAGLFQTELSWLFQGVAYSVLWHNLLIPKTLRKERQLSTKYCISGMWCIKVSDLGNGKWELEQPQEQEADFTGQRGQVRGDHEYHGAPENPSWDTRKKAEASAVCALVVQVYIANKWNNSKACPLDSSHQRYSYVIRLRLN